MSIASTPVNIAKAAIRDIFIQMPTRTIADENWPGFFNQVANTVKGEKYVRQAMRELKKDGWLSHSDGLYRWKKMFGPINPITEQPDWPSTYVNENREVIRSKEIDLYECLIKLIKSKNSQ